MENEKTIAVGSRNRAKLEAVRSVFETVYTTVTLKSHEVDSGIAGQPMTDEESIQGATNRASAALAAEKDADFGVGLEGNVSVVAGRMMLHGWVAIVDPSGTIGLGHSGGTEVPRALRQKLEAGEELGPAVQEMLADTENEIRHNQGTNGILTDGLYTRIDEFTHATQCALAKFVNPDLYS